MQDTTNVHVDSESLSEALHKQCLGVMRSFQLIYIKLITTQSSFTLMHRQAVNVIE